MGLYSSNCFSPPLSLSLPFSRFLAHSNDCHGNHQRCQTTNKRKSFNIHLSQKEQNCSLITKGTIKTVHIYWQGTSHRSICSWIPKNEGRMGWGGGGVEGSGGGVGSECLYDGAMKKKHFNPRNDGRPWKCAALFDKWNIFIVISYYCITHSFCAMFWCNIFLKAIWPISIAANK